MPGVTTARNGKSNISDINHKGDTSVSSSFFSSFDFSRGELSFEKSVQSLSDQDEVIHPFQNVIEQYLTGPTLLGEQIRAYLDSADSSVNSSEAGSSYDGNSRTEQLSINPRNKNRSRSVQSSSTTSSLRNNSATSTNDSTRIPPQVPRIFKAASKHEDTVVLNLVQKTANATVGSTANPFANSQRLTNVAKLRQNRSPEVLKMLRSLRPTLKSKAPNTVRTYQVTSPIYSVTHNMSGKEKKVAFNDQDTVIDPHKQLSPLYSVRHGATRNKRMNRFLAPMTPRKTKPKDFKGEINFQEKKGRIMSRFTKDLKERHQKDETETNQIASSDSEKESNKRTEEQSFLATMEIERALQRRLEKLDNLLENKRIRNEIPDGHSDAPCSAPAKTEHVLKAVADNEVVLMTIETNAEPDENSMKEKNHMSHNYYGFKNSVTPLLNEMIDGGDEEEIVFFEEGESKNQPDSLWEGQKLWDTGTPAASPRVNDRLFKSKNSISHCRKMSLLDHCDTEECTAYTPTLAPPLIDRSELSVQFPFITSDQPGNINLDVTKKDRAQDTRKSLLHTTPISAPQTSRVDILQSILDRGSTDLVRAPFSTDMNHKSEKASIAKNEPRKTEISPAAMDIAAMVNVRRKNKMCDNSAEFDQNVMTMILKLQNKCNISTRVSYEEAEEADRDCDINKDATKKNNLPQHAERVEEKVSLKDNSLITLLNELSEEFNNLKSNVTNENVTQISDGNRLLHLGYEKTSDKSPGTSVKTLDAINRADFLNSLDLGPAEMDVELKAKILLFEGVDFEIIHMQDSQSVIPDAPQFATLPKDLVQGKLLPESFQSPLQRIYNDNSSGRVVNSSRSCTRNEASFENEIPRQDSKLKIICDYKLHQFEIRRAQSPPVSKQNGALCTSVESSCDSISQKSNFTDAKNKTEPLENCSHGTRSRDSTTTRQENNTKPVTKRALEIIDKSSLRKEYSNVSKEDSRTHQLANHNLYDSEGNAVFLTKNEHPIENSNQAARSQVHPELSPVSNMLKPRRIASDKKFEQPLRPTGSRNTHSERKAPIKVKKTRRLRAFVALEAFKKRLAKSFETMSKEGRKGARQRDESYASTITGSSKGSDEEKNETHSANRSSFNDAANNSFTASKFSQIYYGDGSNSILEAQTNAKESIDFSIGEEKQKYDTIHRKRLPNYKPFFPRDDDEPRDIALDQESTSPSSRCFVNESTKKSEKNRFKKDICIQVPVEMSTSCEQEAVKTCDDRNDIRLDESNRVSEMIETRVNLKSSITRLFRKGRLYNGSTTVQNKAKDIRRPNHVVFGDDLIGSFQDNTEPEPHESEQINLNQRCITPHHSNSNQSCITPHHSPKLLSITTHLAEEKGFECIIGLHPFEADESIAKNTTFECRTEKILQALSEYVTTAKTKSRNVAKENHHNIGCASRTSDRDIYDETTVGATSSFNTYSQLRTRGQAGAATTVISKTTAGADKSSESNDSWLTLEEKIFVKRLANDLKILSKIEKKRRKLGKVVADSKVEDLEKSLQLSNSIKKSMKARGKKDHIVKEKTLPCCS